MFAVLLSLAGVLAAAGNSLTDAEVLQQAEAAFQEGVRAGETSEAVPSFRTAAELYEVLRQRGYQNANLFRNQGRAYLLTGDLPRAILAFRRGLNLRPGDRGLRIDLADARAQVHLSADQFGQPPPERWPLWLPRPSLPIVFLAAFVVYTLACVCLKRWYVTRRRAYFVAGLTALPVAFILACLLLIAASQSARTAEFPLVVVAKGDVILRKGNGRSYPPRHDTPLNRGVEARLRYTRGDWIQIELAGGDVGWIPKADALIDQ